MENTNQTQAVTETLEQTIARLQAENAALKAGGAKPKRETFKLGNGLSCAVSEKGAVSIYGLNTKFPVTLYRAQIERLIPVIPQLNAFIQVNLSKLATKPTAVK